MPSPSPFCIPPRVWFLLAVFGVHAAYGATFDPKPVAGAPHLHNLWQASDRIFSGSQPDGDEGFAELRKLGIKTIISVDGSKPDAAGAARFGLRTIHLPHGYDTIPTGTTRLLIKAARTVEGPIYIHCHHGKHRGPAAAAIICQATAGWSRAEADAWMEKAGTSRDYAGLYQCNASFTPPAPAELEGISTNFPASAAVAGPVAAMVEIDERWSALQAVQAAGWKVPANHPDLVPAQEALLLQEAYREFARLPAIVGKPDEFKTLLRPAETLAGELHAILKSAATAPAPDERTRADNAMKSLASNCAACHRKYRN
jgi:protein tyrosine phosphatase (PTP) superfamily phosphohydrolase (DUF442 family)